MYCLSTTHKNKMRQKKIDRTEMFQVIQITTNWGVGFKF